MKQKIIIGLSLVLLVSAVILIGRDLFRKSPSSASTLCCGDEETSLKRMDSTQMGYFATLIVETGLKNLSGIAVSENHIFICGNKEVVIFDTAGNRTGGFLTDSVNTSVTAYGNTIYVASGPSVAGYDWSGNKMITLASVNKQGYITSIAATGQFVFIADAVNKRVLKFTADGQLEQVIGQKDSLTGAPGLIIPSAYFDITTGGFDDLWIVNPGRREIENFSQSGHMRSSWGNLSAGNHGFIGCCNPAHLALLQDGSFVTYEKGTDKIKLFDAAGRFKCYVGGAGSFRGKADFQLGKNNLVKDLATDSKGNIYILDAWNRINIFKPIV